MILSDSTRSIKDKMGARIRTDTRKIGLALKANSKQMGRAAGGHEQFSSSLGAHYLFFVPLCSVGLQFPVFHLQPDSPYLIVISPLSVLLTALFSHSWLRPQPSVFKCGHLGDVNLRAFWPHLSSLLSPAGWVVDCKSNMVRCASPCAWHKSPARQTAYSARASQYVNPGGQDFHLTIPAGFGYGGFTSPCPTALRAKTSLADFCRDCGSRL